MVQSLGAAPRVGWKGWRGVGEIEQGGDVRSRIMRDVERGAGGIGGMPPVEVRELAKRVGQEPVVPLELMQAASILAMALMVVTGTVPLPAKDMLRALPVGRSTRLKAVRKALATPCWARLVEDELRWVASVMYPAQGIDRGDGCDLIDIDDGNRVGQRTTRWAWAKRSDQGQGRIRDSVGQAGVAAAGEDVNSLAGIAVVGTGDAEVAGTVGGDVGA